MLVIRLRRQGSKKRPFYRVVVTDSRAARDGRFVEILGFYNPRTAPETLNVDRERLTHWIASGAQPSDTVRTLVDRMPPAPAAGEDASAPSGPAAGARPATAAPAATEPAADENRPASEQAATGEPAEQPAP